MASPSVAQGSGAPLATLVTTAETAALSTPVLAYNSPGGQGLLIQAAVTGATGAGTTSVQVRVYRGATIAGTLIGLVFQSVATASSFYSEGVQVLDSAPGPNPQYTISVQQVAASGNGTVTLASIGVEAANAAGT